MIERRLIGPTGALMAVCLGAGAGGQCTPLWMEDSVALIGWHLVSIGDVDGDGVRDFILGSVYEDYELSVRSGATGSEVLELDIRSALPSEWNGHASLSRAVDIGDVNGDGKPDVLLGLAAAVDEQPGRAVLFSGSDGSALREMEGAQRDDLFGLVVSALGDLDADGVAEYAVAAPAHDVGGFANIGRVVVYAGAGGTAIEGLYGRERGERFGSALAGGFDWDGDGKPDLAVGSPGASDDVGINAGRVSIISSADWRTLAELQGLAALESFGRQVGVVAPDWAYPAGRLLIGVPGSGPAGDLPGRVEVYDVATQDLVAVLRGDTPGDRFGLSLADAGDVDGDGVRDLIVGSSVSRTGIENSGRVWIFSGSDHRLRLRWNGERAGTGWSFGKSVGGLFEDFDGDGLDDVLIGQAPWCVPGGDPRACGYAYIFSVPPLLDGDVDRNGRVEQHDLGIVLATYELLPDDPAFNPAADVNGDGVIDQQDLGTLLRQYGQGCE